MRAAIIGGGRGAESIMRMAGEDKLGRLRLQICGVADPQPDAPGIRYARETGVPLVAEDYRRLYEIEGLELLIELTGKDEVRDEIERTRPRHIRLIDHFGASLFWELYTAEEAIIRQRTEMRERVEAEREWISQIFDSIPDEILVVDSNMVVQDANASFLRQNRVNIHEVQGRHCYEIEQFIRGECQVAIEDCPFFEVMRTHTATSVVRKHFDADGNPRYAAIVAAPLLDIKGQLAGMIESTRDITHRIRLEEKLRATEVRLQQFMEAAPIGTYVKNPRGQYIEINPAACELFGRPKGEILGKTDLEILPREAAEIFRETDRRVLAERQQLHLDEEVELGGRPVFLSTIKYPVLDAQSNVTAVCGISQDVTDLKLAERELTRTRDYLQNIVDNSPVIIITTDMEGRIVSFNPGAEEALGYRREEVIGKPAAMFYRNHEEREGLLRRVRHEGSARDYETTLLHKDGSGVTVSLTIAKLKDTEGRMIGTVGMSKNITHRRKLINQVMQSERQAAVGRLAAGVAHEINNPLAVIGEIAGYLNDLLAGDPGASGPLTLNEIRESLPKVVRQVQRCRSITHRLLSFARKSEARIEVTEVHAALEEILPFLEKEARLGQVEIHRQYDSSLPSVRVEEIQLQEIFINLIHNAIQAIGKRGRGNIWLTTEQREGKVVVSVRDDGPGIDESVRDRLFDPFVTTKPQGQGTGLGLSICYGIIKRYDGEITVESQPGQGATFLVILPVARDLPAAPAPHSGT